MSERPRAISWAPETAAKIARALEKAEGQCFKRTQAQPYGKGWRPTIQTERVARSGERGSGLTNIMVVVEIGWAAIAYRRAYVCLLDPTLGFLFLNFQCVTSIP
jgi:hypothetical protein